MKWCVVAAVAAFVPLAAFGACAPDAVELRGDWGQARFAVDVANSPDERSQGLMNVGSMATMAGMLFVYEHPQRVGFWMRNTLIPLDMLFMTADGVVQRIHENAIPHHETVIPGGRDDIQFVLEVNGGLAARLGITPGTQLRHPSIPQGAAAWPCE